MGHMQEARVSGYICRLCSEVSRVVILLYGDVGLKLCLVAKINNFLNINIKPNDQLPKTVCLNCVRQVESTHRFIKKILLNKQILKFGREHPLRRAQMDSQTPDGESSSGAGSSTAVESLPANSIPPDIPSEESESDFELDDLVAHRF
uniref:ZAD domain-containing protein n=1 Tax=Phlebotomus kandelakii TaxID=1109342 RepID=A0A6B2EK48_9DIPT